MEKNEMVEKMLEDWSCDRNEDLYFIMSKDSNDNNLEKSFEEKLEELEENFDIDLQFVHIEDIQLYNYYRSYYCLSYIDENNHLQSERIVFFEKDEDF